MIRISSAAAPLQNPGHRVNIVDILVFRYCFCPGFARKGRGGGGCFLTVYMNDLLPRGLSLSVEIYTLTQS
jgi:hypothetical protein